MSKIRCSFASIAPSAMALWGLLWAGEELSFRAKPAAEYAHQTSEKVTVGAQVFGTEDLTEPAFGKKNNLLRLGILPVLLVIENGRNRAVNLENMQVELVSADGRHGTAMAPDELIHLGEKGRKPPTIGPHPLPLPMPAKKNPLNSAAFVERAFAAKLVPAGDSASGFVYFEAHPEPGDRIYLSGISDAGTRRELLYLEFPLEK